MPAAPGLGIARALIGRVEQWALGSDMTAVTLTAFADVPWNGPLHEHLGFQVLTEDGVGSELRTIREAEAVHGLDIARRDCIYIALTDGATTHVP